MKTSLIIFLTIVLFSCDHPITNDISVDSKNSIDSVKELPKNQFEVITYDGCEYLIYKDEADANSSYGFMAHKGNCSNPNHCK